MRKKQFIGVNGMTAYNLFLTGASSLVGNFRNSTNDITLLMGIDFNGNILFNNYFREEPFVNNITALASGLLVNSYFDSDRDLRLVKLNNAHAVQWRKTIPYDGVNYYGDIQGSLVVVKELNGFIYVFFDNMRCIKLSEAGDIVWDHYYYTKQARLDGVEIGLDGNFIMIGARQFGTVKNEITGESDKLDIVMMRITPDGHRLVD